MPPLVLTPRDDEILKCVHRHRFLRSTHIASLVGGSSQIILRRLQLLYHHGYLERPPVQIEYFGKGGSSPIAYGLGDKGAKHLKAQRGALFHHLRWSEKNHVVCSIFLKHALLVSDVMVAFELAERSHMDVSLIPIESSKFSNAGSIKRPTKWRVRLGSNKEIGLMPDRIFAIEQRSPDGSVNRTLYFLEADRGTMPVARKNLVQTSIYRKLLAYETTWKNELHRSLFGFDRFRVLMISTSPKRTASIIEACSKLKSGQGLFLLSDEGAVKSHPDIFSLPWRCVKSGESATILP